MDLNAVVEGRGRESYQALRAFLRSAGGRLFGSVSADRHDECYESFKDELARFARTLGLEERFQLYKDVRNLTVRIPENPVAVSCEYTLEKSFLTQDEINTIERSILAMELSDLQILAKADETPAYAKTLAMAAIIDMKNGKTTTVDRLMDRQYGKPQQKVDITTNGKQIQQGTPLTREEQIAYLKKLEEEY